MTSRIRTGLRLTYEMNTKLIKIAENFGVTKNALMVMILKEWIKNNEV